MKIKLSNIRSGSYAVAAEGIIMPIEFNCNDIKKAIEEKRFNERSFQGDYKILNAELAGKTIEETHRNHTKYHIERIAALSIKNCWKEPVLIYMNIDPKNDYLDGGHRIWAAKCLGETEIDAIVVDIGPEFKGIKNGKQEFWVEVTRKNGNFEEALKSLGIKYFTDFPKTSDH